MFDNRAIDLAVEIVTSVRSRNSTERRMILYHIFTWQNNKSAKFTQKRSHEKVYA